MAQDENLFSDFEPLSRQDWINTATADLKGADFEKKLVWKTDEGIAVQPFYTAEDLEHINLEVQQNDVPQRTWTNYVAVEVTDLLQANHFMLHMMQFGVTGFVLHIHDTFAIHFNILLKGINPQTIHISFKLREPAPLLLQAYFDYLISEGKDLSAIHGFVQADVLEAWTVQGTEPDVKLLAAQLKVTAAAENFKGLMLGSHAFVNAGGSMVQEIAFLLNKLTDIIELLQEEGIATETIISQLALHTAVGGNYFFEIAKLRALRKLLRGVLACYGVPAAHVPVLSSNADWSKTLYDPTVNMLRNTTEAMSAILGGCNAILINPHDSTYKTPDAFSHRIAAHISNLLKEESYFDKVTDPAAGSYYIESMTAQLTENSLQLFRQTEAAGGYIASIKNGSIQQQIADLKDKKEAEIASRRKVYVGTNKYVNPQENIILNQETTTAPAEAGFPLLHAQRATKKFEQLREQTQQTLLRTGKIPAVYLACFGQPAMRTARAGFAAEFFGTAAFEIKGPFFFEDAQSAATAAARTDADIVVICSSDADYETDAASFASTFRAAGNNNKLILAGYPAAIIENLQQAGVDDFIYQKTNVVEFITALQPQLFAVK